MTTDSGTFAPVLPYAGTSGWTGTDTSRDRARQADGSGRTARMQALALRGLRASADRGMTWKDLAEQTASHHGTASGTLSVLHKAGLVVRLAERRERCKVYVLPEFAEGRTTEAPGRTKASAFTCPECGAHS